MAKKKKTSNKVSKPMSRDKYFREKIKSIPLDKCYANENWAETGLAHVMVTRRRKDGNLSVAGFLIDTWCLGVKDVFYEMKIDEDRLKDILRSQKDSGILANEIGYVEAHNLILGAVEFAEEAGIEPHPQFDIAANILEEDTDFIPLINYEFGKNGKYLLMVSDSGKELRYLRTLQDRLGDNFEYVLPLGMVDDLDYDEDEEDDDYDDYDEDEDFDPVQVMKNFKEKMALWEANRKKYTDEPYLYDYPEYPNELNLMHPYIWEKLSDVKYNDRLPGKVIERIMRLPVEEVVKDLSAIIYYVIGKTYKGINRLEEVKNKEDVFIPEFGAALFHSLVFLSQIERPEGFEPVMEILRQNKEFIDYHIGDNESFFITNALYKSDSSRIDDVTKLLYEKGINHYSRNDLVKYLCMIAVHQPSRKDEVVEILRNLLKSIPARYPSRNGVDGTFNAFLICDMLDLEPDLFRDEIKALYDCDCVNPDVVTWQDVERELIEGNQGQNNFDLSLDFSIYK